MRKTISVALSAALLALCVLLSQAMAARAESAEGLPGETSATLQLFKGDRHMAMPKNAYSYWVWVPASTSVSGECTLTLHITASLTIIDDLSSAIVYLNNTPIASKRLVSDAGSGVGINPATRRAEDCHEITWAIAFDSGLLNAERYNEIKLMTMQRSTEGECSDIDNPSNWLVLHDDSNLRVRFRKAAAPVLRDHFPLFYETFSEQFILANDYVLSDLSDAGLAASMMGLANAVGMNYQGRELLDYGVFDKTGYGSGKKNKTFLELTDKPGGWDHLLGGVAAMPTAGHAYVSITGATTADPYLKLRLLAGDDAGLKKATSLFQNRTLLGLVDDEDLMLRSDVKPASARTFLDRKESGQYTFAEYGYDNMTLSGVFHQQMSFSFEQPYGVMGDVGSYVDINFRHSAGLLSERSTMSVKINDVPVGSVKLLPSNADGGNIHVEIPESALNEHTINVLLEAYHYLGPVDCSKDYYDVAWTTIDTERSNICFVETDRAIEPTLKNFPSFYGATGQQGVTFLMPGAASSGTLQIASMFASRTGQNTGIVFDWRPVRGKLDAGLDGDIVLLADRKDAVGSLPQAVMDRLMIAPVNGGYAIDESVPVVSEALEGKAVIQVVRSQWDFYRKIYVMIYDGKEGLAMLRDLLASKDRLRDMAGQICVIGNEGRTLASFVTAPRSAPTTPIPITFQSAVKRVEAFAGMPVWLVLLIALALLLLLITIIRLSRGRRDNEYKKMGDMHKKEQGFKTLEEEEKKNK